MEQTTVQLIDRLDWRLRLLNYVLLYAGTEQEPNLRKILDDAGMLLLEILEIVGAIKEQCILCKPDCPACGGIEEGR